MASRQLTAGVGKSQKGKRFDDAGGGKEPVNLKKEPGKENLAS